MISAPISGGGTTGLTVTGGGIVDLTAINTYTGGTVVNDGSTLVLSTAKDTALGTSGAGNDVTLDNGTLLVYASKSSTALTTARNFTLGAGGGNFELFNSLTISGVVSGGGALSYTNLSAGTLTLTGANTYTGATNTNGTLILSGANGAIAASSGYTLGGELSLDSSGGNNSNRLSDTAALTLDGISLLMTGNSAAATAEKVGATTLNGGYTFLVITPNASTATSLTFASLTRSNNSTLALTGTGLGGSPGAGVATVLSTAAPALIGGGGTAGTQTISIVPWATGNTTANSIGSTSLVTYDSTLGFRPLATAEYATNLTSGSTTNARPTTAANLTIAAAGATVNSLVVPKTGTGLTSTSGGVLNITSGAFLYSPSSLVSGTESGNINFGSAEGIVSSSVYYDSISGDGFLSMSGVLAGTGGLTLNAFGGGYIVLSGANTYTGTTTILSGATEFSGTVANDGTTAGPFGLSKTDIVFNPGAGGLSFFATAASTINRNLTMTGSGSVDFGTTSNFVLTVNGNINLKNPQTTLILDGGETAASAMLLTGNISGSGSITDNSNYTPFTTLSGNNTYAGGTNIQKGTYIAGSNTAFGTGTISFSGAGSIAVASGGAYTLGNDLFFGSGPTFSGAGTQAYTGSVNLNGSQTVTVTGGGTTFGGEVSNGALTKAGTSALTLGGANTYTGGTVISAGSVLVTNTSGSGTGTGAVFANVSGTLLGGTGAVGGPVSVVSGAILEGGIGAATGTLTLNNNLTLATGSIIQLALATDGTHSTLARGGGTWTFAAAQKFTFLGSAAPVFYDNIITGLAGDPGGESGWKITNTGIVGTFTYDGSGDIDLTITSVPEPATVLGGIFTVGLLGIGPRRRGRALVER